MGSRSKNGGNRGLLSEKDCETRARELLAAASNVKQQLQNLATQLQNVNGALSEATRTFEKLHPFAYKKFLASIGVKVPEEQGKAIPKATPRETANEPPVEAHIA